MDDIAYQLAFVGLALFLVVLNGFFVNAEFAIVKVRETRLRELMGQGSRRAAVAHRIVGKMDEYLSATQLGITLASLGLGWLGEPAFAGLFAPVVERFFQPSPALSHTLAAGSAFILITFLHIVIGELAPKSLAIQKAEASVLWTAPPLVLFYRISYPFIWALNTTANYFLRLIGIRPSSEHEIAHSEEELRLLLTHSKETGALDRDKRRLLERVFEFTERSVRQVMVPSVEVKFLDIQKSIEENLELARRQKHTRYPLCDGSLDRVVGIIHVKDLFWNYKLIGPGFDLDSVKRPVHFVPESKGIKSLLADFRRSRIHLAIVVDEFGSMVGMVTLEDVLEELVGEIQDEFDIGVPPEMVRKAGPNQFVVQGRALVEQIESALKVVLDDEENDTIAGHVMMRLGRTAKIGDEVPLPGQYRARVVGMRGLQITDLVIEKAARPG